MTDADVETKADLEPLSAWVSDFHTKADILKQVPLARAFACASAKFKRSRDEASVGAETAATLAATMKELEAANAKVAKLEQQNGELSTLAGDRQAGLEKMASELARYGTPVQNHFFHDAASREKNAPEGSQETATGVSQVTANASRSAGSSMTDHLLDEIMKRGGGNLRMNPSGTSHALLGNTSSEGDLMAALRSH